MHYILIALLTALASIIGTFSGFGISTIMIPVIVLFYPLPFALLFVAVIHLFGDFWKVIFFKKGANWRIILLFGIPGIVFSYLGASLSLDVPDIILKRLLGVFLLIYVFYLLRKPAWKVPANDRTSIAGGTLSGFFAGIFGVGGAIRSAFLAAFNLQKEIYIFTSGMIALFIDVTRISRYFAGGTRLPREMAVLLILLVPLSLAGAYIAKRIINKVPQKFFRNIIAVLLGLIAVKFLVLP